MAILAAIEMLLAGLALVPSTMQQASAQDTDFSFEQDQSNKCSSSAICTNHGTITFNVPADNMMK